MPTQRTTEDAPKVVLGQKNLLKIGSKIQGSTMGDFNVLDIRAIIPSGCVIGQGCTIGATAQLTPGTDLPDHHAVFRINNETKIHSIRPKDGLHSGLMDRQLSSLLDEESKSAIRKHHKLLTSSAASS
mmetsp:Transcript_5830/g.10212  ORF Transcript_5830/g.10212 Transcript_5830/m.10212 type:complete len:128 (+) Transcript_5830:526-909(+)